MENILTRAPFFVCWLLLDSLQEVLLLLAFSFPSDRHASLLSDSNLLQRLRDLILPPLLLSFFFSFVFEDIFSF